MFYFHLQCMRLPFPRVRCCQPLDFCNLMDKKFFCAFNLHCMVDCVCKDGCKSNFYSMCFFFSHVLFNYVTLPVFPNEIDSLFPCYFPIP